MANKTKNGRRLDKNRITLKTGESQRSDGTYSYRWTTKDGKRHNIYAATLEELRQKEEETKIDQYDGIKIETKKITVNDLFDLWCDVDFEEDNISVNHTLVYYNKGDGNGCSYAINTPKTKAGERSIPMMGFVKEAFLLEKKNQEEAGIKCKASVDCYTDFVFVNRFGDVQNQATLNKAIRRIIRDCNDEVLLYGKKEEPVLLPPFSCHSLRHTFTTRLCEEGVNIKVIQDILGHKDISTTLDIYTDVTKDLKKKEIVSFENSFFDMAI